MIPPILRYAISDRNFVPDGLDAATSGDLEHASAALLHQAAQLAREGVDFFQLREKDLPAGELATLAHRLQRALQLSPTRLLINSRVDVAIATRAHGVHLSSNPDELSPTQVHRLYAAAGLPDPLVTVSCHTLAEIDRHRTEPLTAILFGPVFEKRDTTLPGTGLPLLAEACRHAHPTPILALGGITQENTAACLAAGAAGIAAIRQFHRPSVPQRKAKHGALGTDPPFSLLA